MTAPPLIQPVEHLATPTLGTKHLKRDELAGPGSCPAHLLRQTGFLLQTSFECHLPATWDQLAAGFASGMGPPRLPVMGPP